MLVEEVYMFTSTAEMVATADLVVVGTVLEVRPGEIGPADSPEEQIETLEAVVRIDEVLKGRAPGGPVVLETIDQAYTAGNTEWRCPGERALLFLSRSTEKPGGFYITNYSQSAYVLRDARFIPAVHDGLEDPVVQKVENLSLPELRHEVENPKAKIQRGEVKPLQREF